MKLQTKTKRLPLSGGPRLLVDLYLHCYLRHKQQDKGYVLVVVIGMMIVLHALLMTYAIAAKIEGTSTLASADSNTGFYSAEGGLNLRSEEIRAQFLNFSRPSGTSPSSIEDCIDTNAGNNGTGDFACQSDVLGGQSGRLRHTTSTYIQERAGNPTIGVIPRGEPFQNSNMQEYGYKLRSASTKEGDSRPEALLEMDLKSRVVPLFQFAVFYRGDLEIQPGPTMNLNGPVHSNGSLFLGSNATLNITGQVTAANNLFSKRKSDNSTYPNGRVRVANAANTLTNLLSANGGAETAAALTQAQLTAIFGSQIQVGIDEVEIPAVSFLNRSGEYFEKADLRIEYRPTSALPVAVTAIKRNRNGAPTTVLSEGQVRSLLQPFMTDVCVAPAAPGGLTTQQEEAVVRALQVSIASAPAPVPYSGRADTLNTLNSGPLATLPTTPTNLRSTVIAQLESTGLNNTQATNLWNNPIRDWTANEVASLVGKCFQAAPLIENTTFHNNREGDKVIRLLQLNIEGLTVWNKDGVYVDFAGGTVTNNNLNTFDAAEPPLFDRAAANLDAPANSFQRLGLSAIDTTESGLVFHASVDPTITGENCTTPHCVSGSYGFAITNGAQLPGLAVNATQADPTGLTIASDQAVYVQGDYNIPILNNQPAAVLGDSLNVLSNACRDSNNFLSCGINGAQPNAIDTTIHAAFLAGTDITNSADTPGYNGGLENYPRFHENWNPGSQRSLTYRGSFISLGTPLHARGRQSNQLYTPPGRAWSYDVNFNNFARLPPMTPSFVYLRQDLFSRNFDR